MPSQSSMNHKHTSMNNRTSQIPTRSIAIWNKLINRYVYAHIINGRLISVGRAEEDLISLYKEIYDLLGLHASDHAILYKIHTIIEEYESEAMRGISTLNIR